MPMEDDLAVRLEGLFARCPALHGFTVQDCAIEAPDDEEGVVVVANLSLFPAVGAEQRETICDDIAQTLIDFLAEQPAAQDLLRGRTIVRTLH